jgi:hypothetical protein
VFATINHRMQERPLPRLEGRPDPMRVRLNGDEVCLSDGERAVRIPIAVAVDVLYPIAEKLDRDAKLREGPAHA